MPDLITGDLHLTDNSRDAYRHDFMEFTLPLMLQGYDTLYVLGDLTEQKDHHSAALVNRIVEQFYRLSELVKNVVVLCGNHDYAVASAPFFEFLKRIPNISWVGNPRAVGMWLFLPHTNDWKKDWANITWSKYDAVFCHQTFAGAKVGKRGFDGIPTSIFPSKSFHVYSGDIHTPQRVDCVTYVGAPYTIDFGDDYEPRVLALDGHKAKSIPVPGPQKRLLDIKIGDKLPAMRFEANDIIKVRVAVTASKQEDWPKEKDRIRLWATKHDYELWQIQPTLDPADRKRMRTAIQVSGRVVGDVELVRAYAKVAKVSERVLKTGLWIMEQGNEQNT